MFRKPCSIFFVVLFCCFITSVIAAETLVDVDSIPTDFTRFKLSGHDEQTDLLNHYMWYHYRTRLTLSQANFPLEYLTTSDLWLAGATHPVWPDKSPVQDLFRNHLLGVKINPDGYINTQQHFSHSHEQGWPFPFWVQGNPGGEDGCAAGWHFNNNGTSWPWTMYLNANKDSRFGRENAIQGWKLENVESFGIENNKWKLKSTGKSPSITTPNDIGIDAFNAPYLQLRWNRSTQAPASILPYIEWKRSQDKEFSEDRRIYFEIKSGNPEYEKVSGTTHSMITMYEHPNWNGKIEAIRICLAPSESDVDFEIDSFFTVYDTRQTINNPIYLFSCWNYFKWTGDIGFLKLRINQMRESLRFQQTILGGLKFNHIRNIMPGHDGISGITPHPDKETTINYGHGIGSNYWDITAFGWDDFSATSQYYAATVTMAEIEEAIKANPQWGITASHLAFDPATLREHATKIKKIARKKFWNKKAKRFIACIDRKGKVHDYGFTTINLEAIWYGIASPRQSKHILDWITGERIIETDTSQGDDIYKWRFGPRSTTLRNVEWYQFVWTNPEWLPWGSQIQDGGSVLGFAFFDLWARLNVLGAEDAWQRLTEILKWEKDVWKEGGYRKFYEGGKQGTTLQGGGTAGGIGIDFEFYESSLVPSIITYGFVGLKPKANSLEINPKLPESCAEMTVENLLYRNVKIDITASNQTVKFVVKDDPIQSINLVFAGKYQNQITQKTDTTFKIIKAGTYIFNRK